MNGIQQPSGDQFLMVFCPEGGQADDWLVSPEVKGGSEVKFFMTSLATQYEETLRVMVSTTDDELDSFKPLETFVTKAAGWNLYEVKLPEDAKHFALHYVSNDKFGLCIDDIVYSPVSPKPKSLDGTSTATETQSKADIHPRSSPTRMLRNPCMPTMSPP